jgi:hypothetical protein
VTRTFALGVDRRTIVVLPVLRTLQIDQRTGFDLRSRVPLLVVGKVLPAGVEVTIGEKVDVYKPRGVYRPGLSLADR